MPIFFWRLFVQSLNILPIAKELEALRCFYNAGNPEDLFKVDLGEDVFLNNGSSITLDGGVKGTSYRWSTLETTQQITVSKPSIYSVVVTADNGCKVWDKIFINSTFGNISDNNQSVDLNVWPNPTNDIISLTMKATNFSGELDLELINAQGQVVKKELIQVMKGIAQDYSFSVRELAAGSYYLNLNQDEKEITKHKIIITK